VLREHPQLCYYERPSKRRQLASSKRTSYSDYNNFTKLTSISPNTDQPSSPLLQDARVSIPQIELEGLHNEIRQLRDTISALRAGTDNPTNDKTAAEDGRAADDSEREGIHARSGQMGTVHLGSRSVLAYMMGLQKSQSSKDAARTLLEENILPKLGLDNETATYPFVDLWSSEASTYDVRGLVKALPEDAHCRE
jgi:hypothetical protein